MKPHKDQAVDFLHLIVSGKIDEAYKKYVSPDFRHHNPYFPGDADSLEDLGAAVVHIFSFHEGKIVEMWDVGQPVPEDSPNENGMF